jgi:hypothetical protein
MDITALLLVVSLLLLLLFFVLVPVTFTRNWTFSNKGTGLTTPVAHLLGAGLVVLPPPLLEDLAEALDIERHFLVVELGGVDGKPNLPITSSGDISLYLGSPRINCT